MADRTDKSTTNVNRPTYEELVEALGAAISTYEYASMTSWERETYVVEMRLAESVYDRVRDLDKTRT